MNDTQKPIAENGAALADFVRKVEHLYLRVIVSGLKAKEMTEEQARQYSKLFISMVPFQSLDDIQTKIKAFTTQNPYFNELQDYVQSFCDEQKVNGVIQKMVHYLKDEKNVDAALQVAKEAE